MAELYNGSGGEPFRKGGDAEEIRGETLFTTPNPLLKQEGEYLMSAIREFPHLFQEGVGGGKRVYPRLSPDLGFAYLGLATK
jgi:hypothetical protein